MRQNCNDLLPPSLIVDKKDSFSAAVCFCMNPHLPLCGIGVNCATLKVWISSGQAPLMAVGTQVKAFYKLRGDMMADLI